MIFVIFLSIRLSPSHDLDRRFGWVAQVSFEVVFFILFCFVLQNSIFLKKIKLHPSSYFPSIRLFCSLILFKIKLHPLMISLASFESKYYNSIIFFVHWQSLFFSIFFLWCQVVDMFSFFKILWQRLNIIFLYYKKFSSACGEVLATFLVLTNLFHLIY
jgi:hypothetical protein